MTFVLCVVRPKTIWTVADRRLSFVGLPPKDDAEKVMRLKTLDAVALLSYAGLGSTGLGNQPSQWMSNVLRGRCGTLDALLDVLTTAALREIPPHLRHLPVPAHHIVIGAIVNRQPTAMTIELQIDAKSKELHNVCLKWWVSGNPHRPISTMLAGSGGATAQRTYAKWARPLFRRIRAFERGLIPGEAVARDFARINLDVARATKDGSVGERCTVAWTPTPELLPILGGGHARFSGVERDMPLYPLISISNGLDEAAFGKAVIPNVFAAMMKLAQTGTLDTSMMRPSLDHLPSEPDERLR
jgi:hypothetical protein